MSAVQLPVWAAYAGTVGSPVGAFAGVLFAQLVLRRGALELEHRSKREEVLRNMRWAAELAVRDNRAEAKLGVAQLLVLSASVLTDERVMSFVDAALEVVTKSAADQAVTDPDVDIDPYSSRDQSRTGDEG